MMRYFLYLRRVLTRNPREQLLLLLVMVLSISLPLTMSVLYDSYVYGDEQQFLHFTKGGHTVRVENVAPDEVAFFAVFEAYTQIYVEEEAVLFMDPPPEVDFEEDSMALVEMDWQLQDVLAQIEAADGNDRLQKYIFPDLSRAEVKVEYKWFTAVLLAFSVFTQCAMYTLYLHKHTSDLAALLSIGATRGQLCLLTAVHLTVLLPLGCICGAALSIGGMCLLIERFFVAAVYPSPWILFHYSPAAILSLCVVCFAVPLCYGVLRCALMLRHPVRRLLGADSSGEKTRHYRSGITVRRDPATLLGDLFRRRCNRRVYLSAAILLPIAILVLFLSLYESAQYTTKTQQKRTDLFVISQRRTEENVSASYFTDAEMERIAQTADGTICDMRHSLARFIFSIYRKSTPGSKTIRVSQQLFIQRGEAETAPKGSETSIAADGRTVYHAVIHTKDYRWKVGEEKRIVVQEAPLHPSKEDLTSDGNVKLKSSSFYVVADEVIVSEDLSSGRVEAYLYGDAYDALVADNEIESIGITLRDPSTHEAAVAALNALSEELPLSVVDYTVSREIEARRAQGEAIFTGTIAAFLLIFYAILIGAILREYLDSQRKSARTLYTIGADEDAIGRAYLRQMYTAAGTVYGATILLCGLLVWRYGAHDVLFPRYLRNCPLWVYPLWALGIGVYTFAVFALPVLSRNRKRAAEQVTAHTE